MKFRLKFTVGDYYNHVGTGYRVSYKSYKQRVKDSLPYQFEKGYNLKFKLVNQWGSIAYRVSITLDTTIENINNIIEYNSKIMFQFSNFSYKPVKQPNKKVRQQLRMTVKAILINLNNTTMKTFNLNNHVLVQITPHGWDTLRENCTPEYIKECIINKQQMINGVNWYKIQAYQIAELFSGAIWMTNPSPIKSQIIICE